MNGGDINRKQWKYAEQMNRWTRVIDNGTAQQRVTRDR